MPGGMIVNASIMGQQNRSKIYYMDGIVNTSVRSGTYVALPDIDSLQEFKVQSQSDKAEFGGVTGGVVNMTSKSGTQPLRRLGLRLLPQREVCRRAIPFRDVRRRRRAPRLPPGASSARTSAGRSARDKTFFFASYDGWRYRDFADTRHHRRRPSGSWTATSRRASIGRIIYNPYTTRDRERPARARSVPEQHHPART